MFFISICQTKLRWLPSLTENIKVTYWEALGSSLCHRSIITGEQPPPLPSTPDWSIPWDPGWVKHTGHCSKMRNVTYIQCLVSQFCSGEPWLVAHCWEVAASGGHGWRSCHHVGCWGLSWLVAHVQLLPLTLVASKYTKPKGWHSGGSRDWVGRSGGYVALEMPSGSSSSFGVWWSTSKGGRENTGWNTTSNTAAVGRITPNILPSTNCTKVLIARLVLFCLS